VAAQFSDRCRHGRVAGAAVVAGKGFGEADPKLAVKPDTKGKGGGYHVTDHVRSYYRTTLV